MAGALLEALLALAVGVAIIGACRGWFSLATTVRPSPSRLDPNSTEALATATDVGSAGGLSKKTH